MTLAQARLSARFSASTATLARRLDPSYKLGHSAGPAGAGVSFFRIAAEPSAVAVTRPIAAASRASTMTLPDLRADCAHCAALCCVALAFDRSRLFAFDKPAGRPCPHLSDGGACGIHASRAAQGMGGCVAYDCLGAGQRVTQDLFGGRSWLDEPGLLGPMTEAFLTVALAHRLLELLAAAARLSLSSRDRARRDALEAEILEAGAQAASIASLELETRTYLRSLRVRLPDQAL